MVGFENVDIHSLRHSSSTYKLKLSKGDIKSVQGDTGHSDSRVLLEQYAQIVDQNRLNLTREFEEVFYEDSDSTIRNSEDIVQQMLQLLRNQPEMKKMLVMSLLA